MHTHTPGPSCQCCGRLLDAAKAVALELDQRINEYHDFGGVPQELSQGWFDFGPGCAAKARKRARGALERMRLDELLGQRETPKLEPQDMGRPSLIE